MNADAAEIILIDLDGTLTDPFLGISRCISYALDKQQLPSLDELQLHNWIGPPLNQSFAQYFKRLGTGDAGLAVEYYRERFTHTGWHENTVYNGIPELLASLVKSGRRIYLATAKPVVHAKKIVDHFGLAQFLTHSYGAEMDGRRTDKVELLQYIVDKEKLNPALCAMVGDRKHDMHAARYHGMQAIGVLWGYGSEEELLEAGAEMLVETPAQLLDLL